MMRGLWFVSGTAVGVYATTKARRAAEAVTVDGIHDRLTGWFAGARVLQEELRHARDAKEDQLRARLSETTAALGDGQAEPPTMLEAAPDNVRPIRQGSDT